MLRKIIEANETVSRNQNLLRHQTAPNTADAEQSRLPRPDVNLLHELFKVYIRNQLNPHPQKTFKTQIITMLKRMFGMVSKMAGLHQLQVCSVTICKRSGKMTTVQITYTNHPWSTRRLIHGISHPLGSKSLVQNRISIVINTIMVISVTGSEKMNRQI